MTGPPIFRTAKSNPASRQLKVLRLVQKQAKKVGNLKTVAVTCRTIVINGKRCLILYGANVTKLKDCDRAFSHLKVTRNMLLIHDFTISVQALEGRRPRIFVSPSHELLGAAKEGSRYVEIFLPAEEEETTVRSRNKWWDRLGRWDLLQAHN